MTLRHRIRWAPVRRRLPQHVIVPVDQVGQSASPSGCQRHARDDALGAGDLGAQHLIDYPTTDFIDAVDDFPDGVDVILDMVGGAYLERN